MEFYLKLPRNKKEFVLFMAVVSIISVNIIAPLITCFECGFSLESYKNALHAIPFVWPCVIALVLITYKPAGLLTKKILEETDGFAANIIVNIMCTVFMMSIFLTIIGSWIGNGEISAEAIIMFFYKWPRNFAISFATELLIAQPVARAVIKRVHIYSDSKKAERIE